MTSEAKTVIAAVEASGDKVEAKELENDSSKPVEETEDVTAEEAVAEVEEAANDEEQETKGAEQDEEDDKEAKENGADKEDKDDNAHKENGKDVVETTNGDSKKRAATDTAEPEVELKKLKSAAGESESSQVEVATAD